MLHVHRPLREPIPGRNDNMPRALPPIVEHLTPERRAAGRVGHFTSRRPLLGLTAEQEGSVPMPMPSTQVMFPAPMPAHLYNHPAEQQSREEWRLQEAPLLTGTTNHVEMQRRLHQDRGNYRRPVDVQEIGEPIVTPKPRNTDLPFRPVPTDRTSQENRISFHTSLHQANVGRDGAEFVVRHRRGNHMQNETGPRPAQRAVKDGAGAGLDSRPPIRFNVDVSGNAFDVSQGNVVQGPVDWITRETRKVFSTQASGNATAVNWAPAQYTPDGLMHTRPMDNTIFGVGFGPDLQEDQAADRFQRERTQKYLFRAEQRSDPQTSELWEGHEPRLAFEDHESRGQQFRETPRSSLECRGLNDLGRANDTMNEFSEHPQARHFFGRKHQRH